MEGGDRKKDSDDVLKETTLAMGTFVDMECYGCGKKGHTQNHCPNKDQWKAFQGNCNHCRQCGHKKAHFWEK